MRRISTLVFALSAMTYAGCVGDAFTSIPPADAGPDTGCCDPPDSGGDSSPDSKSPPNDSGGDTADASMDTSTDAGADSGCMGCPDASDSGSTSDGGVDSGVDSGTPDSGTDSGVDSGSDSGSLDSGTDAADAGPCVDLTTTCAGNQPLICQAGSWVTNGGLCDYACNSGACLCNDPYVADAGTGRFKPSFGGSIVDTSTSETWYTTNWYANNAVYEPTADTFCTGQSMRLPHESELMAIIAQQSNDVFCSGFDADSQFQSSFSMQDAWYWTDTNPPLQPTHHQCVNFANGSVGDADVGLFSPAMPIDKCYTICISP